jgi:predicted DNA-binding ribbon-helix-helix protein
MAYVDPYGTLMSTIKQFRSPHRHPVWLHGRFTSISVEAEFWEQFKLIVLEHRTTVGKLLAEIDRTVRLMPYQAPGFHRVRNLSSAVRVFVLRDALAKALKAHTKPVPGHDSVPATTPSSRQPRPPRAFAIYRNPTWGLRVLFIEGANGMRTDATEIAAWCARAASER